MQTVTATEYKHHALKLLAIVAGTGESIQITKRGKVIAILMPVPNGQRKVTYGQFGHLATIEGDIIGPIVTADDAPTG